MGAAISGPTGREYSYTFVVLRPSLDETAAEAAAREAVAAAIDAMLLHVASFNSGRSTGAGAGSSPGRKSTIVVPRRPLGEAALPNPLAAPFSHLLSPDNVSRPAGSATRSLAWTERQIREVWDVLLTMTATTVHVAPATVAPNMDAMAAVANLIAPPSGRAGSKPGGARRPIMPGNAAQSATPSTVAAQAQAQAQAPAISTSTHLPRQPLADHVYDFLLFRYGLRDLTELTLVELLDNVAVYAASSRSVEIFARLLTLPQAALGVALGLRAELVAKARPVAHAAAAASAAAAAAAGSTAPGSAVASAPTTAAGKRKAAAAAAAAGFWVPLTAAEASLSQAIDGMDSDGREDCLGRLRGLERRERMSRNHTLEVDIDADRVIALALDVYQEYDAANERVVRLYYNAGRTSRREPGLSYDEFRAVVQAMAPGMEERRFASLFQTGVDEMSLTNPALGTLGQPRLTYPHVLSTLRRGGMVSLRKGDKIVQEEVQTPGFARELNLEWMKKRPGILAQLVEITALDPTADLGDLRRRVRHVDRLVGAKQPPPIPGGSDDEDDAREPDVEGYGTTEFFIFFFFFFFLA
jgi:hypothetical protein